MDISHDDSELEGPLSAENIEELRVYAQKLQAGRKPTQAEIARRMLMKIHNVVELHPDWSGKQVAGFLIEKFGDRYHLGFEFKKAVTAIVTKKRRQKKRKINKTRPLDTKTTSAPTPPRTSNKSQSQRSGAAATSTAGKSTLSPAATPRITSAAARPQPGIFGARSVGQDFVENTSASDPKDASVSRIGEAKIIVPNLDEIWSEIQASRVAAARSALPAVATDVATDQSPKSAQALPTPVVMNNDDMPDAGARQDVSDEHVAPQIQSLSIIELCENCVKVTFDDKWLRKDQPVANRFFGALHYGTPYAFALNKLRNDRDALALLIGDSGSERLRAYHAILARHP